MGSILSNHIVAQRSDNYDINLQIADIAMIRRQLPSKWNRSIDRSIREPSQDLKKARGFITHTCAHTQCDRVTRQWNSASHRAVLKRVHARLRARNRSIFPYPRRNVMSRLREIYAPWAADGKHPAVVYDIRMGLRKVARSPLYKMSVHGKKSSVSTGRSICKFHHEIPCECGSTSENLKRVVQKFLLAVRLIERGTRATSSGIPRFCGNSNTKRIRLGIELRAVDNNVWNFSNISHRDYFALAIARDAAQFSTTGSPLLAFS